MADSLKNAGFGLRRPLPMHAHTRPPPWRAGLRRVAIGLLRPRVRVARPAPPTRVCLFKADRLGDFILSIGAIETIRRKVGSEELTLIVSDVAAETARCIFPQLRVATIPLLGNRV